MKTLFLLIAFFATTALTAQSLSIGYNTVELQRVVNGQKEFKVVTKYTTIVYDFDNRLITITTDKELVIIINEAHKTKEIVYKGEEIQLYEGIGSMANSTDTFKVIGGYSDTQTQIHMVGLLAIYTNEIMEGRI